MSTFHDIALPLQRLDLIRDGLQEFSSEFDLVTTGPSLQQHVTAGDLGAYLAVLGKIYESRVTLDGDGLCYQDRGENPYVRSYLSREFLENDHGLLAGYMMYKTVEKTFLLGKSAKHAFKEMQLYNNYEKYVLTQDIARAALAVSLHNLKREESGPLFLPLRFRDYPLAFLLILSDTLQEYLRWQGTPAEGGAKIGLCPTLCLAARGSSALELEVVYHLGSDGAQHGYFMAQATRLAEAMCESKPQNLGEAAQALLRALGRELATKVLLSASDAGLGLKMAIEEGGEVVASYTVE